MEFVQVLAARVEALSGEVPSVQEYLKVEGTWYTDCPFREYLDWRAPVNLHNRIRLEWLRMLHELVEVPVRGMEDFIARSENLDEDRLRSLFIRMSADRGQMPLQLQDREGGLTAERSRTPQCQAHRAVPPSFVTILEELGNSGGTENAVAQLRQIIGAPAVPEHIIRCAERALWRLIQRMRLLDSAAEPQSLLVQSPTGSDQALIAGAMAFQGRQSRQGYSGRWKVIDNPLPFEHCNALLDDQEEFPNHGRLIRISAQIEDWSKRNPLNAKGRAVLWSRLKAIRNEKLSLDGELNDSRPNGIAEMLLEEGSLAILRNLKEAAILLESAAALFRRSGNTCGRLIAELNLNCCDWRNPARLSQALNTYKECRELRPETESQLPDWNSKPLEQKWTIVENASDVWRPWLIRLLAVEMWQSSLKKPSGAAKDFEMTLRRFYSDVLPPDVPLPEWFKKGPAEAPDLSKNSDWPAILGGLGGIGFLVAILSGLRWLTGGWGTAAATLVGIVLIITGTVFTIQALRSMIRWFPDVSAITMGAVGRLRLKILRPLQAKPDLNRPWESDWEIQTEFVMFGRYHFKFPLFLGFLNPPVRVFRGVASTEYRKLAMSFGQRFRQTDSPRTQESLGPEGASVEMPNFIRSLYKSIPIRIDLEVPREAGGMCWEAIFGQVGGAFNRMSQSRMMFRRVRPLLAFPLARYGARARVRYLGWRANPWASRLPDRFSGGPVDLTEEPDLDCVILHLRGDIVSSGGVLLFVEWSGFENQSQKPPLKIEEILRNFPSLTLLILQGPPLVEKVRLEKDRESASLFRLAADYLFWNGVDAVVILPSMTDSSSERALTGLAKAMHGYNSSEALRQAVRSIQAEIDEKSELNREDALELAYDVCYYSNKKLHFP
jgi:hypothetical protein